MGQVTSTKQPQPSASESVEMKLHLNTVFPRCVQCWNEPTTVYCYNEPELLFYRSGQMLSNIAPLRYVTLLWASRSSCGLPSPPPQGKVTTVMLFFHNAWLSWQFGHFFVSSGAFCCDKRHRSWVMLSLPRPGQALHVASMSCGTSQIQASSNTQSFISNIYLVM